MVGVLILGTSDVRQEFDTERPSKKRSKHRNDIKEIQPLLAQVLYRYIAIADVLL